MVKIDELVKLCNGYVVNGIKVQHSGETYDVYDFNMEDNNIVLYTKRSNEQIMQDAIKDIMNNFNFERVHKVMEYINWTYYDSKVPDIYRLQNAVTELLKSAFNGLFKEFSNVQYNTYKSYIAESGGFKVEVGSDSYMEEPTATVSFILEEF